MSLNSIQVPHKSGELSFLAEQVKSRVGILDLFESGMIPVKKLRISGDKGVCCCPLHNDRSPSFGFSISKNLWYCFACAEGGDVIRLYARYNGISDGEAIKELSVFLGISDNLTPKQRKKAEQTIKTRKLQALLNSAIQKEIDFVFDKLARLERGAEYYLLQVIGNGEDPLKNDIACWWLGYRDLVGFWLDCLSGDNVEERLVALEGAREWII